MLAYSCTSLGACLHARVRYVRVYLCVHVYVCLCVNGACTGVHALARVRHAYMTAGLAHSHPGERRGRFLGASPSPLPTTTRHLHRCPPSPPPARTGMYACSTCHLAARPPCYPVWAGGWEGQNVEEEGKSKKPARGCTRHLMGSLRVAYSTIKTGRHKTEHQTRP